MVIYYKVEVQILEEKILVYKYRVISLLKVGNVLSNFLFHILKKILYSYANKLMLVL